MTCSILSSIATGSEKVVQSFQPGIQSLGPWKCWQINWSSFFSNKGRLTCEVSSRHLWAYSLIDLLLSSSIACKLDLSGSTSILNLYCLMKASTKSFHFFFTLVLPNRIYQVRAASLKLSWKKWSSSLSSQTTSAILLQYTLRWVTGHWFDEFRHSKIFGLITLGPNKSQ